MQQVLYGETHYSRVGILEQTSSRLTVAGANNEQVRYTNFPAVRRSPMTMGFMPTRTRGVNDYLGEEGSYPTFIFKE